MNYLEEIKDVIAEIIGTDSSLIRLVAKTTIALLKLRDIPVYATASEEICGKMEKKANLLSHKTAAAVHELCNNLRAFVPYLDEEEVQALSDYAEKLLEGTYSPLRAYLEAIIGRRAGDYFDPDNVADLLGKIHLAEEWVENSEKDVFYFAFSKNDIILLKLELNMGLSLDTFEIGYYLITNFFASQDYELQEDDVSAVGGSTGWVKFTATREKEKYSVQFTYAPNSITVAFF